MQACLYVLQSLQLYANSGYYQNDLSTVSQLCSTFRIQGVSLRWKAWSFSSVIYLFYSTWISLTSPTSLIYPETMFVEKSSKFCWAWILIFFQEEHIWNRTHCIPGDIDWLLLHAILFLRIGYHNKCYFWIIFISKDTALPLVGQRPQKEKLGQPQHHFNYY